MNINTHIHHNHGTELHHIAWILPQLILALPFVLAFNMYILAAVRSSRNNRWPLYRTVLWSVGVLFAVIAVAGPLANLAHTDFIAHMLSHLLLGMLAPLLMVLAAPMTLLLKTLSIPLARRLTRMLRSWPSRILTHPIIASLLNIGGLWLLYTTNLYSLMHENTLLYLIVHFHIFVVGYLFTVSIIYIDPMPHRFSFLYRSIVLIISLAGHGVLSKIIFAHPPTGVPWEQAKLGGMLMYYGGDAVDMMIIFILCLHWFRATRPRTGLTMS
ncbi:cytochrome c oxidase assembly protein [Paenibacillus albidus]|nr:cytochrome c oxidase assembly protein [Paenibacillus albidus]MBT2293201.1 cytochrome c oxidase assembly protein [Paenibacillus albidus]